MGVWIPNDQKSIYGLFRMPSQDRRCKTPSSDLNKNRFKGCLNSTAYNSRWSKDSAKTWQFYTDWRFNWVCLTSVRKWYYFMEICLLIKKSWFFLVCTFEALSILKQVFNRIVILRCLPWNMPLFWGGKATLYISCHRASSSSRQTISWLVVICPFFMNL